MIAPLGAEAYFGLIVRGADDIAGGVMMGLAIILVSVVVAVAAAVLEYVLAEGAALKIRTT